MIKNPFIIISCVCCVWVRIRKFASYLQLLSSTLFRSAFVVVVVISFKYRQLSAGYPSADAEKAHARPHPRIRRDDGDFWSTHERFLFFISLYYPCDSGNKRTKEAKGNAAAATTNIIHAHRSRKKGRTTLYTHRFIYIYIFIRK